MIRKLIPVLLVAALSACTNTGTPRSSSSAPAAPSATSSPSASDSSPGTSSGSSYGSSYGSSSSGRPTGKTCDATGLQSQIGQKATPAVLEDLRGRSGATIGRILRPGQLVTMEYNDTRLNLIVDDKDVMTAIRCG